MVGMAVATMVFSTAVMKVAAMQAVRIRLRRPVIALSARDIAPSDIASSYDGRRGRSTP
jgi:hypothetical protein